MTNAQERKQQERQARRRRIQRAAREVFVERGYAKTSIEQIARQASLSVGAIYLYFRSKEDLYVSLLEDTLGVFDAELTQVRGRTDAPNRLRAAWNVLTTWATNDVEGTRTLRLLATPAIKAQLSDEVIQAVGAGVTRVREHLGATVADGIHAGAFRAVNAGEIADALWSLFVGALDQLELRANLDLAVAPVAQPLEQALSLVLASLAPDPRTLQRAA
ncbi:MAG TPA: TetR/AcrR family transcriptional regulator [Kofleriaceae bacterium]|jgi:AcrR family transcriptional regulator|nr:TetR/AcrR family transcriptional regulator [Kofleriaceae bacterium]